MTSRPDPCVGFLAAASTAGLEIKGDIIADGKIHRCHVSGDGKGKKNGWYVLFLDGIAAGSFGSWKTGQSQIWCAKSDKQLTKAERLKNKQRMDKARVLREAEEAIVRAAAKDKAVKLWNRAGLVDAKYEYVLKKGIKPIGAKQLRNMLVLPLDDIDGVLHSLQFIYPDGSKRFLTGGRKKGCFTRLPGKRKDFSVAYVVEGWATGCSVRAATNENVFVCFDAGNLLLVCQDIRKAFPDVKIVICADDDYQTDGNPGITKAVEVAEVVGGFVAKPDFGDERPDGATDFNDLHQHLGLDAVLRDLESAVDYSVGKSNPALDDPGSDDNSFTYGLERTARGDLKATFRNIYELLQTDERWRDVLIYDEFAYRIMKVKPPPYEHSTIGEWSSDDDLQTVIWFSREYGFSAKVSEAADAIDQFSKLNSKHPVRDYILGIKWDGITRIDDWITDYIGAPKNDYIMRVSRWYLMGMVARVFEPGVKFDFCLVLEGKQGRKKSSMFRTLGGDWYADTDLDLQSKDAMSMIRGKWLYEIAELGSLARSESTRQKSFLSREKDEFRPPFGHREISSPRQLVFGGTTNETEWNKDSTGGRRFWPVVCEREIDCSGLADARDQLFGEAYHLYKAGKRYWPTSAEQKSIFDPEQFKRNQNDAFEEMLEQFVSEQINLFLLSDAAEKLKIDPARLSRDHQTRIGKALFKLGCKKVEKRKNSVSRYWYQAPDKKEESKDEDTKYIPF